MRGTPILTILRETPFLDSASIRQVADAYRLGTIEEKQQIRSDINLQQRTDTTRDVLGTIGFATLTLIGYRYEIPGLFFFPCIGTGFFVVNTAKGYFHYRIIDKFCKD